MGHSIAQVELQVPLTNYIVYQLVENNATHKQWNNSNRIEPGYFYVSNTAGKL